MYDMQVGIVPQISCGSEIQERCVALISAARRLGMKIFYNGYFVPRTLAAGKAQLRRAMVWKKKEEPQDTMSFEAKHISRNPRERTAIVAEPSRRNNVIAFCIDHVVS